LFSLPEREFSACGQQTVADCVTSPSKMNSTLI
jgi:hypothetical protein